MQFLKVLFTIGMAISTTKIQPSSRDSGTCTGNAILCASIGNILDELRQKAIQAEYGIAHTAQALRGEKEISDVSSVRAN